MKYCWVIVKYAGTALLYYTGERLADMRTLSFQHCMSSAWEEAWKFKSKDEATAIANKLTGNWKIEEHGENI